MFAPVSNESPLWRSFIKLKNILFPISGQASDAIQSTNLQYRRNYSPYPSQQKSGRDMVPTHDPDVGVSSLAFPPHVTSIKELANKFPAPRKSPPVLFASAPQPSQPSLTAPTSTIKILPTLPQAAAPRKITAVPLV